MTRREKIMVFTAGLVLFFTAYYYLLIVPANSSTKKLKRMIIKHEKELVEIKYLTEELSKKRREFSAIEKRLGSINKGFSSLTLLENIAQKSDVRDRITSITPQVPIDAGEYQGATLEIKMEDVSLARIIKYIYQIENSEYWIKTGKLILKTSYGKPDKFDARFIVVSFSRT